MTGIVSCTTCEPAPDKGAASDKASTPASSSKTPPEAPDEQARHRVVFGDRTSQAYLLLLEGTSRPPTPTREQLVQLVEQSFAGSDDREEVALLIELIRTAPPSAGVDAGPDDPGSVQAVVDPEQDLLGLYIEVVPVEPELIPTGALEDDVLLRELDASQRASLSQRSWAILLRADYRHAHGVRGLRLLQTLVRLLAAKLGALVHDPDTAETLDLEAFERRRLRAGLGNIADQIAIVPFADARHEGRVRLTTRGMRRFGSVDLELDGLPPRPELLQRATDLLYGLALVMIKEGEIDRSGFAIELDDTVRVHWRDAADAYAGREGSLPRCDDCAQAVLVHLVEREREPQDPRGHVVARVVAPREVSDADAYQHPEWVEQAIGDMFGSPATN